MLISFLMLETTPSRLKLCAPPAQRIKIRKKICIAKINAEKFKNENVYLCNTRLHSSLHESLHKAADSNLHHCRAIAVDAANCFSIIDAD